MYITLQKFYNKTNKTNKIIMLLNFLYSWLFRIIVGVPKHIIIKSFLIAVKFDYFFFKSSPNAYIVCNILPIVFEDYIIIENKRIYKTDDIFFNFNPPKYKPSFSTLINNYRSLPDNHRVHQLMDKSMIKAHITYIDTIVNFVQFRTPRVVGHLGPIFNIFNNQKVYGFNATTKEYYEDQITLKRDIQAELKFNTINNKVPETFYTPGFVTDKKSCVFINSVSGQILDPQTQQPINEQTLKTFSLTDSRVLAQNKGLNAA